MNEAQFEEFVADCVESMQEKNAALDEQYGIGHFGRWDHDGDRGVLTFSNPENPRIVEAETTEIGSFSLKTKTWLWAWANGSHTEEAREKSARLQELFEMTGMRVFSDAHFDCDAELAWELAAASARVLDGMGCYRGPVGHLWVFWSIDSVVVKERGS